MENQSVSSKYKAPPNPNPPAEKPPMAPLPQPQAPPTEPQVPNLMQKLTEMTGGDNSVDHILSKGKELIFMKFGLGKWVLLQQCMTAFLIYILTAFRYSINQVWLSLLKTEIIQNLEFVVYYTNWLCWLGIYYVSMLQLIKSKNQGKSKF